MSLAPVGFNQFGSTRVVGQRARKRSPAPERPLRPSSTLARLVAYEIAADLEMQGVAVIPGSLRVIAPGVCSLMALAEDATATETITVYAVTDEAPAHA